MSRILNIVMTLIGFAFLRYLNRHGLAPAAIEHHGWLFRRHALR